MDKPRWDPIAHMNAARARKPASGGKTYKRNATYRPVLEGSWDAIEILLKRAVKNFRPKSFRADTYLSDADWTFIKDNGGI